MPHEHTAPGLYTSTGVAGAVVVTYIGPGGAMCMEMAMTQGLYDMLVETGHFTALGLRLDAYELAARREREREQTRARMKARAAVDAALATQPSFVPARAD